MNSYYTIQSEMLFLKKATKKHMADRDKYEELYYEAFMQELNDTRQRAVAAEGLIKAKDEQLAIVNKKS